MVPQQTSLGRLRGERAERLKRADIKAGRGAGAEKQNKQIKQTEKNKNKNKRILADEADGRSRREQPVYAGASSRMCQACRCRYDG